METDTNIADVHFRFLLPEYKYIGNENITKFIITPSGENFKSFEYNGITTHLRKEEYEKIIESNIKIEDIKQLIYTPGQSGWIDGYEVTVIS